MNVIFLDVDNTLLDFDGYVKETMKTGFRYFGLKEYEPWMYDTFIRINTALWVQLEKGELDFEALIAVRWNLVFEALGIDFDGVEFERYFQQALNESAIAEEGAYELLHVLSKNYRLFVTSNGPHYQQTHRLVKAGMDQYFEDIFVSEKAGASKPSRAFFDYVFAKMKNPPAPQDCLIIGDSLSSDITGAMDYGIRTCWYRRGSRKIPERQPDYMADTLMEIVNMLAEEQ